jgi:hypothetical protein
LPSATLSSKTLRIIGGSSLQSFVAGTGKRTSHFVKNRVEALTSYQAHDVLFSSAAITFTQ